LFLLVCFTFWTCEDRDAVKFTVTFLVTNNRSPLEGAEVTINGTKLALTGTNGTATTELENGDYEYKITAAGFQDKMSNVTVAGQEKEIPVEIGILTYNITMVVKCGETKIANATINLDGNNLPPTDNNGETPVVLPNGIYWYYITVPGYSDKSNGFNVEQSDKTVSIELDEIMVATSLVVLSGNNQSTDALSTLTDSVIVKVLDQRGNAVHYEKVSFSVTEGTVSRTPVYTNATGKAGVKWKLGIHTGEQMLTITAKRADNTDLTGSPVTLSATATNKLTSVTDADGNIYQTTAIGNQLWTTSNLKTILYNDGTPIQVVTDNTVWADFENKGKYCWYNNDETNKAKYGALYNLNVVISGKVCPVGWHVPIEYDWRELEAYLKQNGHAGTEGNALKSASGWSLWADSEIGTNDYGFTAYPGGERKETGVFENQGYYGSWWSSTPVYQSNSYYARMLGGISNNIMLHYGTSRDGHSVRCIRD